MIQKDKSGVPQKQVFLAISMTHHSARQNDIAFFDFIRCFSPERTMSFNQRAHYQLAIDNSEDQLENGHGGEPDRLHHLAISFCRKENMYVKPFRSE